jgi:hypothetical protein
VILDACECGGRLEQMFKFRVILAVRMEIFCLSRRMERAICIPSCDTLSVHGFGFWYILRWLCDSKPCKIFRSNILSMKRLVVDRPCSTLPKLKQRATSNRSARKNTFLGAYRGASCSATMDFDVHTLERRVIACGCYYS